MRLIDADALKRELKKMFEPHLDEDKMITLEDALVSTMITVEEQPTVEIPSVDYPCMTCVHHCRNNLNYQPKEAKGGKNGQENNK